MYPRRRQDGLIISPMDGELVVYDEQRKRAHSLNRTATVIFDHCDGSTSIPQLKAVLEQEFGERVSEDVVLLGLDELDKAHLLVAPAFDADDRSRRTRRKILRAAGSIALMLPAVQSITAPTPAAAVSIQPPPG